jgi:hypothetical protein
VGERRSLASLNRHWYLEWDGPRPDNLTQAAVEAVRRDQEAATQRRGTAGNDDPSGERPSVDMGLRDG